MHKIESLTSANYFYFGLLKMYTVGAVIIIIKHQVGCKEFTYHECHYLNKSKSQHMQTQLAAYEIA